MNQIKNKLLKKINLNKGYIPIDKFIEICMYDNKNGYYINNNPIGRKGDFITSPEISQLFGEIIGLYIIDYWKKYIKRSFNLIELGPGRGTLIKDLINISKKFPKYLSSMNLRLVEINKRMIINQKKILKNNIYKLKEVKWSNHLKNLDKKETIFIANEFFDCFPIKQTLKINEDYFERVVKYNNKNKVFKFDSIKLKNNNKISKLTEKIYKLNNLKDGSIVEIETESKNYIKKIAHIIKKNNGLLIMIDYGNFIASGYSTLQSIKKHKESSFLKNPGHQDLSHMIVFSEYIQSFKNMNLNVYGPYYQKDFFSSLGIHELKNKISLKSSNKQQKEMELGLNRIISDQQMGLLFKVLIVSSRKLIGYEK